MLFVVSSPSTPLRRVAVATASSKHGYFVKVERGYVEDVPWSQFDDIRPTCAVRIDHPLILTLAVSIPAKGLNAVPSRPVNLPTVITAISTAITTTTTATTTTTNDPGLPVSGMKLGVESQGVPVYWVYQYESFPPPHLHEQVRRCVEVHARGCVRR